MTPEQKHAVAEMGLEIARQRTELAELRAMRERLDMAIGGTLNRHELRRLWWVMTNETIRGEA